MTILKLFYLIKTSKNYVLHIFQVEAFHFPKLAYPSVQCTPVHKNYITVHKLIAPPSPYYHFYPMREGRGGEGLCTIYYSENIWLRMRANELFFTR